MTEEYESPMNWVGRKGVCTLQLLFEQLRKQVDYDISIVNRLPAERRQNCEFQIALRHEHHSSFSVTVKDDMLDPKQIQFSLHEPDYISVSTSNGDNFNIHRKWEFDSATCKYYIGDEPQELWQISQKALSKFFFGW